VAFGPKCLSTNAFLTISNSEIDLMMTFWLFLCTVSWFQQTAGGGGLRSGARCCFKPWSHCPSQHTVWWWWWWHSTACEWSVLGIVWLLVHIGAGRRQLPRFRLFLRLLLSLFTLPLGPAAAYNSTSHQHTMYTCTNAALRYYFKEMYKTAVYTLVNGGIQGLTHQKQQKA